MNCISGGWGIWRGGAGGGLWRDAEEGCALLSPCRTGAGSSRDLWPIPVPKLFPLSVLPLVFQVKFHESMKSSGREGREGEGGFEGNGIPVFCPTNCL